MNLPAVTRKYLLNALSGTPDVLEGLLNDVQDISAWDFRPDPARFTLREIVAHLADWEPIGLGRVQRMVTEAEPILPDVDEGQVALDNDYAHSDPHHSLTRFREGRAKLLDTLRTLDEAAWGRLGERITIGRLSVEMLAVQMLAHDGYHTQQIAQWLRQAPETSKNT